MPGKSGQHIVDLDIPDAGRRRTRRHAINAAPAAVETRKMVMR